MLRASKRRANPGALSTSTLTSFRWPARSLASWSSAGLTIRHGGHHSAHRSTKTGTVEPMATVSKSSSPASVTQGSDDWHLPHLGTPCALAGTRFFVPQFTHATMSERSPWSRSLGISSPFLAS
jgi:hypothetical protein